MKETPLEFSVGWVWTNPFVTKEHVHELTHSKRQYFILYFSTKIIISVFLIKDCESNKCSDARKDISFPIFVGQFYTLRRESMFW